MTGSINVNVDALNDLLSSLKYLRDALDEQKQLPHSLSAQLTTSITGTSYSIAQFELKFQLWAGMLNLLTDEMDDAYSVLYLVLTDADNAIAALQNMH